MPEDISVRTFEFDVNKRIEDVVEQWVAKNSPSLPDADSPLVEDYVRKIEGRYDVLRSKVDTDHAVDLLYIAYNAVPQKHGTIRAKVSMLMGDLVNAQGKSKRQMDRAANISGRILKMMNQFFPDWREIRNKTENNENLQNFLTDDMVQLAGYIQKQAEEVATALTEVAEAYEELEQKTQGISNEAEVQLGEDLEDKAALEAEINRNNAEREKLEALVEDLEASINKYQAMADQYASRAKTAEERAFIMSIVRVGAEMISSMAPAVTAALTGAATGGSSVVAANAMSTAKQATNRDVAKEPDDSTADEIEKKKEAADAKADKKAAEAAKEAIEKEVEELEDSKTAVEADTEKSDEAKQTETAVLDERIAAKKSEIEKQNQRIETAKAAVEATQAALDSLGQNMREMAQEQKDQASNLRDLQLEMINKVEKYETEKRNQNAELVLLNVLLKGQRSEEETIKLTIKALQLSIRAIKRVKGILVEIAAFFRTFAAFMGEVIEDAKDQNDALQMVIDMGSIGNSRSRRRIVKATSQFFITQGGEWMATQLVASKFSSNFDDGFTRLNRLSSDYLTGQRLIDFMAQASDRIDEIVFIREEAARTKQVSIAEYRARIESDRNNFAA